MSLRRSSRVKASPITVAPTQDVETKQPPRKRQKKAAVTAKIASTAVAQDEADKDAMPPPATPKEKRPRVAKNTEKPPPFTPTPAAIGLMTNTRTPTYSSGDIDGASPPPDRRVEAGHANANLITPGGTQVQASYSNFEEPSPSKPTTTTTGSLLETACNHLLSIDPKLKPLIDKHHCRVFSPIGLAEEIDPFRSLTSGIIAQQVSGAAAKSIKNKFIALFPAEACPKGFPPPALVAQHTIPKLREAGLSQRKAEYIQGLAAQFASGDLTASFLLEAPDEEVMAKLVAVRGLGAWSVEMFMCFALKRLDVFSTGDLGVQRGMAAYVGRDVKKLKAKGKGGKWKYMSEKEMLEIAERFRPYRSLFMWYMWRIEEVDTAAVEDNA